MVEDLVIVCRMRWRGGIIDHNDLVSSEINCFVSKPSSLIKRSCMELGMNVLIQERVVNSIYIYWLT